MLRSLPRFAQGSRLPGKSFTHLFTFHFSSHITHFSLALFHELDYRREWSFRNVRVCVCVCVSPIGISRVSVSIVMIRYYSLFPSDIFKPGDFQRLSRCFRSGHRVSGLLGLILRDNIKAKMKSEKKRNYYFAFVFVLFTMKNSLRIDQW